VAETVAGILVTGAVIAAFWVGHVFGAAKRQRRNAKGQYEKA
jgi:hypothetical protein